MHKLTVALREMTRGEDATIESVEPRAAGEDLVFLVGLRAYGLYDDPVSQVRTVPRKLGADR